jgi:uncharacterized surface protein with fasciclin (FAS1) repeats
MVITNMETLGVDKIEVLKAGYCVTIRTSMVTANVIAAAIGATNGVIHVVHTCLLMIS